MRAAPAPETGPGPTRTTRRRRLRVGLIGGVRFPQGPPFAGGLEAHTWALAEGLRAHVRDLRRRVPAATSLVVQVDEPALPAVLAALIAAKRAVHVEVV